MDFSIIKQAFALRDEARALQRDVSAADQSGMGRALVADEAAPAKSSALDARGLALMKRAAALHVESAKFLQKNAQPTGARALALLTAASTPLGQDDGAGPRAGVAARRGGKPKAPAKRPSAAPARKVPPLRRGK